MEQMFDRRGSVIRDVLPAKRHRRSRSGRRRMRAWAAAAGAASAAALLVSGVVYGGSTTPAQHVVVHRGDTLWQIAASHFPGDDLQQRIAQIESLNHLPSGSIRIGEVLTLPAP